MGDLAFIRKAQTTKSSLEVKYADTILYVEHLHRHEAYIPSELNQLVV